MGKVINTGVTMIAASSTRQELFEGARAVTQARARLDSAAALTPVDHQAALLRSLAVRFARLESALEQLAEAFEPHG
jgi:hypothetical protein